MPAVQKPPPESVPIEDPKHRRALAALLLGACLFFGAGLGRTDLWAPDEPRYGAIAEELRSFRHGASGLVLLHLNDTPYTQKPPLYFWLAALLGAPADRVHEVAARAPSAIAGILSVGLCIWIARVLLANRMAALLAAGFLATSFRFAFTARRAQLDVLLTFFELTAVAIFVFLESKRGGIENARRTPLAIAALHASLGAAALVKGPVGWLPLLVFCAYLAWEGRFRAMRAITPFWSWALSIGPLALWALLAVSLAPPGFAEIAIEENLVGRFFEGTSHARPFYYYAIQLPLDFLPWSLLLPFALPVLWRGTRNVDLLRDDPGTEPRPGAREDEEMRNEAMGRLASMRFLVVWTLVPLVFFSLSAGKRGLYLLPIFPALAMICVLGSGLASRPGDGMGDADPFHPWLTTIRAARVIAIVAGLEFLAFILVLPTLQEEKSPRPIAQGIASHASADEPVGVYGMSPLEGGLLYYGAPAITSVRDEDQLRAFLAADGRLVLMRARHFDALRDDLELAPLDAFRSGRRRLVLAERAHSGARRDDR